MATIPTFTPSEAQSPPARRAYESNGYIVVPEVFGHDEMRDLGKTFLDKVEVDKNFANIDRHIASEDILGQYPRFVQPHRWPETAPGAAAKKLMLDQRLLDISSNLIGPLLVAQSMFHFKPPTARGQAMHQDDFFLRTEPDRCLAAWIAVDDADEENGAIQVIPGSHRMDVLCHEQADMSVSYASMGMPLPPQTTRVQTRLRAGDVLFFDGHVAHGSNPNKSTDRFRRCLIYHYVPETVEKINEYFQPLVGPTGEERYVGKTEGGGPCGSNLEVDVTAA